MKVCSNCKQLLPFQNFAKNRSRPDGLHVTCKSCKNDYNKRWFKEHQEEQQARVNANTARYLQSGKDLVLDYLNSHPCVDCGESDPIVLEFDHVRGEKVKDVCTMRRLCATTEKLLVEIAKCEVRCANCHRRKTYRERGYKSRE